MWSDILALPLLAEDDHSEPAARRRRHNAIRARRPKFLVRRRGGNLVNLRTSIRTNARSSRGIEFVSEASLLHTVAVIPRAGGVSSTPRLLGSIIAVSGILDHPPARAMTTEYDVRDLATPFARGLLDNFPPSRNSEGAGKTGCLLHPRSRVRFAHNKLHTSIQGSWSIPAFPAQWLYGLLRALPGERLFCLRRRRETCSPNLAPAPRRPNHTTSPYAQAAHVSRSSRVHRISPRVRDDGQRPSSAVRRAELCD